MATIPQTLFSDAISWMNIFRFDWNLTEVFPKSPIDNNPA